MRKRCVGDVLEQSGDDQLVEERDFGGSGGRDGTWVFGEAHDVELVEVDDHERQDVDLSGRVEEAEGAGDGFFAFGEGEHGDEGVDYGRVFFERLVHPERNPQGFVQRFAPLRPFDP